MERSRTKKSMHFVTWTSNRRNRCCGQVIHRSGVQLTPTTEMGDQQGQIFRYGVERERLVQRIENRIHVENDHDETGTNAKTQTTGVTHGAAWSCWRCERALVLQLLVLRLVGKQLWKINQHYVKRTPNMIIPVT